MRWVTVGGRDSAPLSRLRRQLGRNYRRATARSLPARLPGSAFAYKQSTGLFASQLSLREGSQDRSHRVVSPG